MQIHGKTALVTGAAGGLGQAIADELSRRGASLVLSGRNRAVLDEMAQRLGARVEIADLEQPDDVERLSAIGAELDIVVANAGIGNDVPLTELDTESIDRSISVNLRAPILMTTAFVQAHLSAGTPGHVVFAADAHVQRHQIRTAWLRPLDSPGPARNGHRGVDCGTGVHLRGRDVRPICH